MKNPLCDKHHWQMVETFTPRIDPKTGIVTSPRYHRCPRPLCERWYDPYNGYFDWPDPNGDLPAREPSNHQCPDHETEMMLVAVDTSNLHFACPLECEQATLSP